jgi:hypothetical protein
MVLLGALNKADADNVLETELRFFCRPKLLIIDDLGYLLFQLVSCRCKCDCMLASFTHHKHEILDNKIFEKGHPS